MRNFGEFAREAIRRLGKSQKELADVLDVSPAYISQILTGKKSPPDLGRPRNRVHLTTWSAFLEIPEDDILERIRYELHRVPPRPDPRFGGMRRLLLARLKEGREQLADEIRAMEMHPAESLMIKALVRLYLIRRETPASGRAYGRTRFEELTITARSNKDFVEGELVQFFNRTSFSWMWDAEVNDVRFFSDTPEISDALDKLRDILDDSSQWVYGRTVPVVGHVSAGEGFEFTDGGFGAGEGFEQVDIPPGIDPALAKAIYCVRIRGDSLEPSFGEGTLLFIKPESWAEIKDGDLVIFKDRIEGKAFVKKVEFAGENLVLRSLNPQYRNIVIRKEDLILLEKVRSVAFT
jgi:SOS-response transcriptional repressor LexA